MKKTLKALAFISTTIFAGNAFSTEVVCDIYPKNNGNAWGNGTDQCFAMDFSFGNSTSGKYYLKNISKPIHQVIWSGHAKCNGGTSCSVTVRAYSSQSASATVLYKDGTYEELNSASMFYETGH